MSLRKIHHKVVIVMGSQSDYSTMKYCKKVLQILNIKHETKIVSAHRTPERMYKFSKNADNQNSIPRGKLNCLMSNLGLMTTPLHYHGKTLEKTFRFLIQKSRQEANPVSYTHLTLPTIYSV